MDQAKKSKLLTKNFIIIFFIDVLFASCFGILASIIPLWLSDRFKADSGAIGLVLGVTSLSTLISRPFMGYAIDRWSRKSILRLSLCLFALLNLCFLFAQSLWAVSIIRFLQCIPFAAITTCNITIATDSIPAERRGEGLSYFTAAATLPMAIGPAIGLALFKANWYWPFIVASSIGVLCFIFSSYIKIQFFNPQIKKFNIQSLFNKKLLMISLVGAISISVLPGVLSYLVLFAKEISLNLNAVGIIMLCYAICLFIVRVFGAKIISRTSPKITGIFAMVFLGIGVLIIGVSHDLIGIATGAILVGIGSGTMLPTMLMMALRISPTDRGLSNSMVFGGVDIAQSAGSYGFGAIAKLVKTYGNSYIVFSGFEIIGILVFLLLTIPHFEKDRQG